MKKRNLTSVVDTKEEGKAAESFAQTKTYIAQTLKETMQDKKVSLRTLGKQIGMTHPQIIRITRCDNYHIDTLLKVLDGLDMELVIRPKQEKSNPSTGVGGKEKTFLFQKNHVPNTQ